MPALTVTAFIAAVRDVMDATGSNRWSDATIQAQGGIVHLTEWSALLNQNAYFRFAQRSVTTDSSGRIVIADLTTGTTDTVSNFYRVLIGPTDGISVWNEVSYRDVPTATTNPWPPEWYLFYLAGDYYQLLPAVSGQVLTIAVNHYPCLISDLASGASTIIWPAGYEYLLVYETAATLLLKDGAESSAASDLFTLAESVRQSMYGQLARRSTKPTQALYNDRAGDWGAGSWG